MVPVIVGWTWQLNVYVPGVSNRHVPTQGATRGVLGTGGAPAAPPATWHEAGFNALVKLTSWRVVAGVPTG
jgi:hypothetical protein